MTQHFTAFRRATRGRMGGRTWLALMSAVALAACSDAGPVAPAKPALPTESVDAESDAGINAVNNRFAYLWNDQASAPLGVPYTPTTQYSYNAKGLANSMTRTAVGTYVASFGGMAKGTAANKRETFIVTPYGLFATTRCVVGGWFDASANLNASVRCVNTAGAPADAQFTLLMVGSGSLPGRNAFAWASQSSTATYTPSALYSYTSSGGTMTLSRSSTGIYAADLAVPRPAGGRPETYLVSTYNDPDDQCTIGGWSTLASVFCYSRVGGGALSDAQYDILTLTQGRPGRRAAFAFADNPHTASYTPSTFYSYSSSGGAISITRGSAGNYTVNFAGLQKLTGHTETVMVSGYANGFFSCRVNNWSTTGTGLAVSVSCVSVSGIPVDEFFTIAVLE